MAVVLFSCEKKFDLKMDGEKIIFVECFPGIKDFIALKVLPALPLNCDYDINRFSPDVKLMVNGDMVEVKYMEQGDSLRGIPNGYWVAEYAPLPEPTFSFTTISLSNTAFAFFSPPSTISAKP